MESVSYFFTQALVPYRLHTHVQGIPSPSCFSVYLSSCHPHIMQLRKCFTSETVVAISSYRGQEEFTCKRRSRMVVCIAFKPATPYINELAPDTTLLMTFFVVTVEHNIVRPSNYCNTIALPLRNQFRLDSIIPFDFPTIIIS